MRRNIRTVFKFLVLAGGTVFFTVITFRLIRGITPRTYTDKEFDISAEDFHKIPQEPHLDELRNDERPSNERIDWHDYVAIKRDAERIGVAEQGVPVTLSEDDPNYESLYKVNGFNAALSDKIALDRAVPDIRHKGCMEKKYLKDLLTVSVIVPFHNEHWTTLLRTAQSVINRSPVHLLKEVILVDDCSTKEFSKKPLDDYLAANMSKVRSIHLPERSGLIRARLEGAKVAIGEVLVFLDSHTEANVNWLPPLLEPIRQDYRTCTCPFIDVVQYETFEYRAQDEGARGAFDWELYYKRLPLLPEDLARPTEPFKSPIMAGGLFAISAKFFWELGGYDEGLDIWGGEQYELSFKIWMCGGQMVDTPCSRVGHIYRKYAPFPNPGRGDFLGKNFKRVLAVWMDEYAEYVYKRKPNLRNVDPGDLTVQRGIRDKLNCKSFKWFMENVAFDLPKKYPYVEPPDYAGGELRSIAATQLCVDTKHKDRDGIVTLDDCLKDLEDSTDQRKHKMEQYFNLTWHKDIRPRGRTLCLDVSDSRDKAEITLYGCHGGKGNQYWKYDVEKQWVIHGGNPRCLDCDPGEKKVFVSKCDEGSVTQRWRFEVVNLTAIANWENAEY